MTIERALAILALGLTCTLLTILIVIALRLLSVTSS